MTWYSIIDWLLDIISKIGEFAAFLFTPIHFSDLSEHFITIFGGWFLPQNKLETIIQVFANFFNTNNFGQFINSLSFTPIALISVSALIVILILHFIDLIIAWW